MINAGLRTRLRVNKIGFSYGTEVYNIETGEKIVYELFGGKRGKRGKITTFSGSSKSRFMKAIISVNRLPDYFMTLTFPSSFPDVKTAHSRFLRVFLQFLKRKGMFFLWRLELQKRGAPHYHILCYSACADFDKIARNKWVDMMQGWNKENGSQSRVSDIKKRAIDIEKLDGKDDADSIKKVFLYVAKYCTKVEGLGFKPSDIGTVVYEKEDYSQFGGGVCRIVGDGCRFVEGRSWGKVGFPKIKEDDILLSGTAVSRYVNDINPASDAASSSFTRTYHVFRDGEADVFVKYLQIKSECGNYFQSEIFRG